MTAENKNRTIGLDIPAAVAQVQRGDEAAYKVLFGHFSEKIYLTARKMMLCHEDAQETVQEVFLIIWKNRDNLNPDLSFNAYLLTILKSLIYKRTKKEALKAGYVKYAIQQQDFYSNETESQVVLADLEDMYLRQLDKLPKGQKEIFVMKSQQHLKAGEIAEKMSISKRTVESQIYKATKAIKLHLYKNDVLPPELLLVLIYCGLNF
jgi:RNA polymerase sigma factor (sigma-70 family)